MTAHLRLPPTRLEFCSAHFEYTARQELPPCVMEVIRNTFKDGSVTGFKEK